MNENKTKQTDVSILISDKIEFKVKILIGLENFLFINYLTINM